MEEIWLLVTIAILVAGLGIGAICILKKCGWKREVDYKNHFYMGIIWVPLGVVFSYTFDIISGFWFFLMGAIFLIVGLKNRKTWGKVQKVNPKTQKMLTLSALIIVIALAVGILIFECVF